MSEGATVTEGAEPPEADAEPAERRRRGWVSLYAVAFALMLVAGAVLGVSARGFLNSFTLLWTSIILSGAAILVAIVNLFLPRR